MPMRATGQSLRTALLALLALLVIGAAPAQAHEWTVEGQDLQELEVFEEQEEARFSISQQSATFTFEWPLSFHTFKWLCTKANGSGYLWPAGYISKDAISTAKIEWFGCGFTEEFKYCYQFQTAIVANVKGELVENEKTGAFFERYVPSFKGAPFFEFSIWNENCVPEEQTWNFGGSFSAQLELPGVELLTQPQTFSPAIDSAMGTAIKANESTPPVRITGTLNRTLTEELKGQKWGAY
jgi:hypothetical protein